MSLTAAYNRSVIVGLGKTGLSVARFLAQKNIAFSVVDSRKEPPELVAFQQEFPSVDLYCGPLDISLFRSVDEVFVSPGVSINHPVLQQVLTSGVHLSGDIDLFVRYANAPLVAITGSNAKSTVTRLLGDMLSGAGMNVAVGGNIGEPALNLLRDNVDCYVLELSSFQLETTQNLNAAVATCLNISEDHMDRYDNIASYKEAKHRIFSGAQRVVVNRDDSMSFPTETIADVTGFSVTTISNQDTFALFEELGATYLSFAGEKILSTNQLSIKGKHNYSNALAALALGHALGVDISEMLEPLKHFNGLSHRCQWIANSQQVAYYNDSKATNVGATIAAINGLGSISDGLLVLIAGGDAKQADFSGLFNSISKYCRAVVLIGRDAHLLASFLSKNTRVFFEPSLKEAVIRSRAIAEPGDSVLLSPACSSLDMFTNFEERGEQFCSIVKELTYA